MSRFAVLAAQIDEALGNLANVDEIVARARTASDLMQALSEDIRTLERVVRFVRDADAIGVTVPRPAPIDEGELAQISQLAEELESDPAGGVDPGRAAETRAKVARVALTARRWAEEVWSAHCAANPVPQVPQELIDVFGALDADAAEQLEGDLLTSRQYSGDALPSQDGMRAYQEAVARVPGLLVGFGGDSQEVRDFLEAVASGGAPLSLLNDDVLTWLERGTSAEGSTMADLFRVVLRRSRP